MQQEFKSTEKIMLQAQEKSCTQSDMNYFISGTIQYEIPGIWKATIESWAQDFLREGKVCFTNIEVFKKDEDPQRGDSQEGTCISIVNNHRCQTDHVNKIFVWCGTMENNIDKIQGQWKDRNSIIQITNTTAFSQRIVKAMIEYNNCRGDQKRGKKKIIFPLMIGPVTYDKDDGTNRVENYCTGIFQKNYRHNSQKEFRFAFETNLVNDTEQLSEVNDLDKNGEIEENIFLLLGNCNDIAKIVK